MTRPRLLIISFSTIESDARVLKQVQKLGEDGEVHTIGYGAAPAGAASHIRIPDEFPIWRYSRSSLILRRFRRAYWRNQAIAFASDALMGTRWDVIVANDVDAVGLALVQDSHGVHADLHEYAPRQKEDVPRWRLFVAPFVKWMCREFVAEADSVTTLGQGIADEYHREFGFRARIVTNASPYHHIAPNPVSSPIRLVHSGAGLRDRNLLLMAEAAVATTTDVTFDFYLTANDPEYIRELRAFAETSGGRVRVLEPVRYTDLITTLSRYDVGVFLLPPVNFNYRWTLPNKFFDYVQARLGVVIGPSPEMSRVLEQHCFGAVADDFDAEALTRVLDDLTPDLVSDWKRAADGAAAELSGESQTEVWGQAVHELLTGPRAAGAR